MLIIREKLYCIDPQHYRQTKNDYFVVSFKIFARPLMNPCQIRPFRKICHLRETHNYRHASFFIKF